MRKFIVVACMLIAVHPRVDAQQKWDKPMELKNISINIRTDRFTATTFIEMEFCNPNDQEIEGLHRFELRPGQVITAFQLDLHGKFRDGSIEEKWKATNAYNTIVGKRIDPALLTMDYPGHYNLRIYPVPAKGCRKVTMTIQESLVAEKNNLSYSLPLNINEKAGHLRLGITVDGNTLPVTNPGLIAGRFFSGENGRQALEWNAENILMKDPISFFIPLSDDTDFCTKVKDDQTFFALRFRAPVPKEYATRPKTLAVFWDASASLASRDIKKEINFIKQFISYHNVSQLTIVPFNYKLLDTAVFYTENGFNSRWQQYLENISYDGATQLGIIDLTGMEANMFLLFSDGNNTYGRSKPKTGNALLSCIYTSHAANLTSLQQVVGYGGGKVIDLKRMSMSSAVAISSRGENWLMNITSSSGNMITEQVFPLKHEDVLLLNGTMKPGADTLYFHYGNNDHINHVEKLVVDTKRQCGESPIDRMNMLNNFDRFIRNQPWSSVVDFGVQEKIVTPHTAYIVLERVEDYVKYNIAPPKELEAQCEKMNFVKKDTRFERKRVEQASEFDILRNVVSVYNERIKKWDANGKPVNLDRSAFDKTDLTVETGFTVNTGAILADALNGKMPGIDVRASALDEVIVTGYGTSNRKSLTGAVAHIRSHDIFSSATSVEQALQGRVAGLEVNSSPGFGSTASIRIRGTASFNNNEPLFILDGIPVSGNINDIVNVQDIDNITVLKDQHATALYGSRAYGGAIIITTKRGKNYYNRYNNKPYRLKDMEDMEYLRELKSVPVSEKMLTYEDLKNQYGGEPGFYFDVAQHLYAVNLKKEAFNILMNAAEAANGSQPVLIAIAYILEGWKQFDEVARLYEELIKGNPFNLTFYNDLAWAHYNSGNYQQAVDILYAAIKLNTGQSEAVNLYLKSMLMNDMNAIISLHNDKLDISAIPAELIKPMPVDMRIQVDCNMRAMSNVMITEPGNQVCSYSNPVTKNGGTIQKGYYWYNNYPFEYQVKKAPDGKYLIRVNYNDYYFHPGKIPSVMRIRTFKNFGQENQVIEVENVMMDNQHGEIEIGEIRWEKK